jgi:tetratricopeptide (TPR) repeat protein
MRIRFLQSACCAVLACLAAASAADAEIVYLVGGGSYRGKVRIEGDLVVVEIPEGSISLDRESVLRIEPSDDLGSQLADKRARLDPKDADGHYKVGVWARQNDLPGPARELFLRAVAIQPDHVQAQLALGRLFFDGDWMDADGLQESVSRLVSDGQDASAWQMGRAALAGLLPQANRRAVLGSTATAARRLGYFAESVACYKELLTMLTPGDSEHVRAAAIVELLESSPGGLYLVQINELTRALDGGQAAWPDRSGFYSLANDAVLSAALRDRATQLIAKGQAKLDAAQAVQPTDQIRARTGYSEAEEQFGQADALVAGIARSYRVEVRRRLIQMHQSVAEAAALRFEQVIKSINPGKAAEYRTKLKFALSLLDDVQKDLDPILVLARPYPQEFSVIVAWTQEDLDTVRAMRKTLEGELTSIK